MQEGGGEVGGASGTVEPGPGNVAGAVAGAVTGAVVAVVAPQVYSKPKDEAGKAWTKFQTGVEHLGKLAGRDKDPPIRAVMVICQCGESGAVRGEVRVG